MKKTLLLAVTAATALTAGAYRIPENSLNSVALSAAYAANANGADAAYYNPAAMGAIDGAQHVEAALTYIGLTKVHFEGTVPRAGTTGTPDSSGSVSNAETFLVPTLHYVSPAFGRWRYGASIVSPGGLSKRWEEQPARGYALDVTLQTIEINPSIAYQCSPQFSIGGGVRLLYAQGVVQSASEGSRDMAGDGTAFAYNLALSVRPFPALKIAATYRSEAELHIEGDAKLYFPDDGAFGGSKVYDGSGSVDLPLPAVLQIAAAYTFNDDSPFPTTVEFVYEKDYWSAFKALDIEYGSSLNPLLVPAFDDPIPKAWKDTDVYRLGVTQKLDALTVMAGIAIDKTPVPEKTLNFELPDADAVVYSAGARYRIDSDWDVGGAVLYDRKYDRTIHADKNDNGIDGTFSNTSALLVTLGAAYRF